MAGTVTALKLQKRNRQRVNVYLDDRFAFGLAAIEAARLRVGQVLSDEEIARLKERDSVERAAERALDLLSYRPRSRAEVRRRLLRKGYEQGTIDEALARLGRAGLLDDRAFARYWIDNRFQFNPRGVALLRQELWQKGVGETVIEETLAEYDEEEAAVRAVEMVARRLHELDPVAFRRKLIDRLRRRGFPYAVIEPLLARVMDEHTTGEAFEEDER